jgi:hypothetical protein
MDIGEAGVSSVCGQRALDNRGSGDVDVAGKAINPERRCDAQNCQEFLPPGATRLRSRRPDAPLLRVGSER